MLAVAYIIEHKFLNCGARPGWTLLFLLGGGAVFIRDIFILNEYESKIKYVFW
jgi:hypothetical protein